MQGRTTSHNRDAHSAVRQSEATYRELIETTGTGYLIIDEAGRVLDANAEYVRLTGHARLEEILGRCVLEWTAEYDLDRNAREVALCVKNRITQALEIDYVGPDGGVIPIEIHANVVETPEGLRILALCKDITDRKRTESELQEAHDELERRVAERTAELKKANRLLHYEIEERKQAERAQQSSQAVYASLVEGLDQCVFRKDREGRITFGNSRYCEMLGRPLDELLGKTDDDLFPAHFAKKYRIDDRHVLETGEAFQDVQQHERPNGERLDIRIVKTPVHDAQGNTVGVQGIFWDITQERRSEQLTRESERRLKASLNATQTSCWEVNLQTAELVSIRPSVEWMGYAPDEIPTSREWWKSLIHPDDVEIPRKALAEHLEGREDVYECEYRVQGKSGEWYWTLDRGKVIEFDGNGKPLLIAGTDTDITERKRAEEALRKSEQRFRSVFEQAGVAVGIVESCSGRFVRINGKYEDLIGYSNEEMSTKTWMEITHPDDLQPDLASMHTLREGLIHDFTMEKRLIHQDGSIIWINLTVSPLWNSEETPGQHMVIVEDISERKRSAEDVEVRARQQAAVAELGRRALSGVEIDELFQDSVGMLSQVLDVDYAKVMELSPDGKSLRFAAGAGWDNDVLQNRVIPVQSRSQAGLTLSTRDPVVVEDFIADDRFVLTQPLKDHRVTSGMTVVIHGRSHPFGVLGAHTREKRVFSTHDINFLQAVANTLGEAIDRKRAEEALSDSEHQLRLVTDAMPAFISYLRADRCYGFVNRHYESMFGLEQAEIIGRPVWEVLGEENYQAIKPRIDSVLSGKRESYEAVVQINHHGERTLNTEYIPDITPEGMVRGYYSLAVDITQRKQAEADRMTALARLESIARNVPDCFWSTRVGIDGNLEILYVSPGWKRIWGHEPEELYGNPYLWLEAIVPEDVASAQQAMARVLTGPPSQVVTYRIRSTDGALRWIEDRMAPIVDESGTVTEVEGVARDITAQKEAEEAARRHFDELAHVARLATAGELATGLAHELNQPLAAIAVYCDVCSTKLREVPEETASLAPLLEKLKEQTLRAGAIVHRIRRFVKKEGFTKTASRLEELVTNVCELLTTELAADGVSVDVDLAEGLPTLFVDPVQIEQVLLNLAKNACEAMRDNGPEQRRLTVLAEDQADGFVVVTVRDTGPGMVEEAAAKIFDAFYSTKAEGMGIGLAICRTIVEAHGGRITHEPHDGRGARFQFTLPKHTGGMNGQ